MKKQLQAKRSTDGGFTLVELLVSITVLGVLAAVVTFGVANFRSDAVAESCASDANTVNNAALAYFAATGNTSIAGADDAARIAVLTGGDYLAAAPSTGNGYSITLAADGTAACVLDA